MATLRSQLKSLVMAFAADVKALRKSDKETAANIGTMSQLTTQKKGSLVEAINEVSDSLKLGVKTEEFDQLVERKIGDTFAGKFDEQLDTKFGTKFDEKLTAEFAGKFDEQLNSKFDTKFDEKLNKEFDGKFDAKLTAEFDGKFDAKLTEEFAGKFDSELTTKLPAKLEEKFKEELGETSDGDDFVTLYTKTRDTEEETHEEGDS